MIPVSVSDIIKLLDEIPIWRNVSTLPKRMTALEERISALEAARAVTPAPAAIDSAKFCPLCGKVMKVTAELNHPTFHFAGVKVHSMTCESCGHHASREYRPGSGYT